ncbi:MAG: hypothetical protein ACR2QK_16100, partial [Acidimicrobiales bacterium]
LQSEEWPGPEGVAADLEAVRTYDDERLHLDHLASILASARSQVEEVARLYFGDDLAEGAEDFSHAIAAGLLDRVCQLGLEIDDWDAPIFRPLERLSEAFPHRRQLRNLAVVAAARRVPYDQAKSLDAVSSEGRVYAVPGSSSAPIELYLASVGATRWHLQPSQIRLYTVEVVVDGHAGQSVTALSAQVLRAIEHELQLEPEPGQPRDWGRELSRFTVRDHPVTVILRLGDGPALNPAIVRELRAAVPWTNIIVVAGTTPRIEQWARKAEAVILAAEEDPVDADRFYRGLSSRFREMVRVEQG